MSTTDALVLTDTDSIRFVPNNTNADSASITYYGWDQSDSAAAGTTVDVSTTGSSTAFSSANASSSIVVTDENNQPVLTSITPVAMTSFGEGDAASNTTSAPLLISVGIGSTISDQDVGALSGIAITGATTSNGYWEYSSDNVGWIAVPNTVSASTAMVLADTYYLRFVSTGPDGVTATLDFVAWDQTDGNASETTGVDTTATFSPSSIGPFSSQSNSITVVVDDLNDAPELAGVTTSLGTISEDDADGGESNVTTYQLSTVLSSLITDTDTTSSFNNLGIAVTGVSNTNGRWDSSTDGTTWTAITGVSSTSVLVFDQSAVLRFVPDSTSGTTATLTFLAWDQSDSETSGSLVTISTGNQGNDGAYSLIEDTFSITVTDVNDQPNLADATAVALTPTIQEGQVSSGFNLFTVLDPLNTITDVDDIPLSSMGVALTSASSTLGYWEYNTGSGWTSIPGTTSTSDALLFDVSSSSVAPEVRFTSTGNNGVVAELIVYAWDQSSTPTTADVATENSTNGSTSIFSASSRSITLQVTNVNNQPELDVTTSPIVLTPINEGDAGTPTTASVDVSTDIVATMITDQDTGSASGIAVTSASTTNGYWEYSSDNVGWTAVPNTVSVSTAMVLTSTYYLRFVSTGPDGVTATLDFVAWDQTDGNTSETTGIDTTGSADPTSVFGQQQYVVIGCQ